MTLIETQLSRAVEHHQSGRHDEAESIYRAILRQESGQPDALNLLGVLCTQTGREPEGLDLLGEAVRHAPAHLSACYNRAKALESAGRLEEAIIAYRAILRIEQDHVSARFNLAAALHETGRASEAMGEAEIVARIDPAHDGAHHLLGMIHHGQGDLDDAIASWERAATLAPDRADVLHNLGQSHEQRDETGPAIRRYRQAIVADPSLAPTHRCLAALLARTDALDEAASVLESAARRFTSDAAILSEAVRVLRRVERPVEAEALVRSRLAEPGRPDDQRRWLLFALGDLLDDQARPAEAFEAWSEANALKGAEFDANAHAELVGDIIETFDAARLSTTARAAAPAAIRPVVIVGMPRSGTSLVEQILTSHPEIDGAGESNLFQNVADALGQVLGSSRGFPHAALRLDVERLNELADSVRERLVELVNPAGLLVTEKSPSNVFHLGLIAMTFPDARFIACERDPRDTGLSCFSVDFAGNHPFAYDLESIGVYLRDFDRLMRHWHATLPQPIHTVRYEDLVNDQEAVTRRLLAFCDVDFDDRCLRFHENTRVARTASRDQVNRPLYATSVGRHAHYAEHLAKLTIDD